MQISMTAELYNLDMRVFRTVTEAFIKQEMIKAVKEFLVASLVRIPLRTGFLRGSFLEVAKAFGARGTGAGQTGYATKDEYYYPNRGALRILKTPRSGIKYVTSPNQVLQRKGDQIIFDLTNIIRYYQANDIGNGVLSAPWNSAKEGLAAMVSYLEDSPHRFPNIESILTTITIRTTGNSTTKSSKSPNIGAILATRQLVIEGF